jgi:hypothetical protein
MEVLDQMKPTSSVGFKSGLTDLPSGSLNHPSDLLVAIVDLIANVRLQIVELMYCSPGNFADVFADLNTRFWCEQERRYSTGGCST